MFKITVDIASKSFVTLVMEGQVERTALWDAPSHAVCSACILCILPNVVGHLGIQHRILHTAQIIELPWYVIISIPIETYSCNVPQTPVSTHTQSMNEIYRNRVSCVVVKKTMYSVQC